MNVGNAEWLLFLGLLLHFVYVVFTGSQNRETISTGLELVVKKKKPDPRRFHDE